MTGACRNAAAGSPLPGTLTHVDDQAALTAFSMSATE